MDCRLRLLMPALAGSSLFVPALAYAQLAATYQFKNTLAADETNAPALTPLNSGSFVAETIFGQARTVYQRTSSSNASSAQSALRLDTTPLSLAADNYAVEMVFTFTDNLNPTGRYRRIVDSFDPSNLQDPGFYVGPGDTLNVFQSGPHSGGPVLADSTYYDVVLSVSSTGEQAYLNGAQAVSYGGTPDRIATHYLTFFQDDSSEYGNGKVALIRVFNRALSSGEVTTLNNGGNPFTASSVPESGLLLSFALVGAGATGRLLHRRRRRDQA